MITKETLKGMNKKQLYDYCRTNGIKGYSNMNKAYINNLILQSYKSGKQPAKKIQIVKKESVKKCKVCKKESEIAGDGLCYDCYDKRYWKQGEMKHPIKRRFEFYGITPTGGKSAKFWEVWQDKKTVFVRFGGIGTFTGGRVMKKDYDTIEHANKVMKKQIRSKISKGYNELKTTAGYKQMISSVSKPKIRKEIKKTSSITRIRPMLASQNDAYLDAPGYIAQQKYDGTRCLIIKKNNSILLKGRSWKSDYAPNFPEIIKDIKKIPLNEFILDSELTFFKGGKDVFLTALAKEESKKDYIAKCMIFDILEYNNKNVKNLPLSERLKLLEIVPKGLKHLKVVKSYKTNHKKIFENIISDEMQGEGVVLKDLESKYMESGRTKDWIKVKGWKSDEAIIVGVTHGTGARKKTFGALILAQYRGNKLVYVGKASGFKESEQLTLINKMKNIKTMTPKLEGIPHKQIKYWVRPKIVVEVKFQELTKDGKFRFPSFLRIRNDKTPKECTI